MKVRAKLFVGAVVAVGIAFGVVVAYAGTVEAAGNAKLAKRCKAVVLVGHRGEPGSYGKKIHDENTMASFNGAIRRGADEIETDLRVTSDGVWVLMHDPTVNRTTNGNGEVAHMTFAEVQALKTTHGYPVPSLDKMISTLKDKPVHFQLELKPQAVSDEKLTEIVTMLQNYGVLNRVIFTSSSGPLLKRMSTIAPDVPRGLIAPNGVRPSLAAMKKYNANSANISYRDTTAAYVKKMHAHGYGVSARSVATPKQYRNTVLKGVDRVVTDHTRGYTVWCNGL